MFLIFKSFQVLDFFNCPFGDIVWETSRNQCVSVCVRPSGDFENFRNNIWVRGMILLSIKNHARFLGIFKTDIKKENIFKKS